LNILAILVSLFVPWIVFVACFALLSFQIHYSHAGIVYFILVILFVGVVVHARCAYVARAAARAANEPEREASWMVFQSMSLFLALIIGAVLGIFNYKLFTLPYHQVTCLNDYHGVDPARVRGQQLLDAGSVVFTQESRIDASKAMGFRNLDMFCVAPITSTGARIITYDFWAVGRNCCSGTGAGFNCPHYRNPRAHAALRLIRTGDREYYRLAVQQAEATHNISAAHPLFFEWDEDPSGTLEGWKVSSIRNFIFALSGHFIFQAFIVAAATVSFTKIGSP